MTTFTEIAGDKLSDEQKFYLEGLFAGLKNRGLAFTDVELDPALASTARPSLSGDLIFEERVKRELHPLDAYPQLLDHAARNSPPDKEATFRFKWHGLFHLAPHKEGFMCRLRIPGGVVKTFQWRELARTAQELTSGYVQITTRANMQIRLIEPKNAPEVLRRVQSVGLHSRGSGADNIRNITCNPTAGLDPHELIDTLPLAQELGQYIINHREFYDLPRKFNIAFDGGGLIGSVEDTNDIGLQAARVISPTSLDSGTPSNSRTIVTDHIAPGVYYRVALGGATGHQAFARDLGVLVRPEEALKVVAALVRVFIANGNRNNRKKARLKHLLETWPLEQYLAETEKLLGYQLLRAPAVSDASSEPDQKDR
jgi:ferredoxin-nitrite reductase